MSGASEQYKNLQAVNTASSDHLSPPRPKSHRRSSSGNSLAVQLILNSQLNKRMFQYGAPQAQGDFAPQDPSFGDQQDQGQDDSQYNQYDQQAQDDQHYSGEQGQDDYPQDQGQDQDQGDQQYSGEQGQDSYQQGQDEHDSAGQGFEPPVQNARGQNQPKGLPQQNLRNQGQNTRQQQQTKQPFQSPPFQGQQRPTGPQGNQRSQITKPFQSVPNQQQQQQQQQKQQQQSTQWGTGRNYHKTHHNALYHMSQTANNGFTKDHMDSFLHLGTYALGALANQHSLAPDHTHPETEH